jgi:hypothetical protein
MQPFFHFLAISRGSHNTTESVWGCARPAVLTSHESQDSDAWGQSQLNAWPSARIVANWASPPRNNLDHCRYCTRRPSPRSPGDRGVNAGQVWRQPINFFVFFSQSSSDRRCLQRSERSPTLDRICRVPLATAALSLFFLFSLTDRICDRKSQRQPQLFPI